MTRQTMLLGIVAAVAVVALWWLFLYSPGVDRIEAVESEIAAAEAETASLQGRIARLEAVRSAAPETEAAIANLRGVVPVDPALAGVLRQLEAAAADAGMTISSLGTARPAQIGEESELHAIALTITAQGSFFQIVDYLRRLEDPTITTRGVIISSVSMAPAEYPSLTVAITGQLFAELPPTPDPAVVAVEVAPVTEPATDEAPAEEVAP